jgi:hypothetical protein
MMWRHGLIAPAVPLHRVIFSTSESRKDFLASSLPDFLF